MRSTIKTVFRFIAGSPSTRDVVTSEFFWRALWLCTGIIIVSYASYLFLGSMIVAEEKTPNTLKLVDLFSKEDEHLLTGRLLLPSACHSLKVRHTKVSDTEFALVFTTWSEPSRKCEPFDKEHAFSTVIFSPARELTFTAVLDDTRIPVIIERRSSL